MEHYVTSNGARLWTCSSGHGTPFLMFNGGPGCDDYLGPVAGMIEDICQVIRFEPRGCGRSDWDGNYAVETMIEDAESVRRAYGVERCIVGGHSFGPDLALAYTLRFPDHVIGLIGIAGGRVVNDRTWSEAYHRNLDTVGEDLGGVVFAADENVNPQGNRSWREYIKRPTLFREIGDLRIPATFINGSKDIRPSWPTRQLAALMPNGRYIEIAGAAHTVWLTHAVELRAAVREAVARIRQAE
ncbi:MAG: alpha/beta hydrolase [Gammaproteobacteria bacterium]|nr:alpha/beta hydrolase [Gammaproteobacteria bacterium]